jgi:hypothetical protein
MYIHTYIRIYIPYIHTYVIYIYIHTCVYVCIYTYTHAHVCIYTYIHTHTHTHTHTHLSDHEALEGGHTHQRFQTQPQKKNSKVSAMYMDSGDSGGADKEALPRASRETEALPTGLLLLLRAQACC